MLLTESRGKYVIRKTEGRYVAVVGEPSKKLSDSQNERAE